AGVVRVWQTSGRTFSPTSGSQSGLHFNGVRDATVELAQGATIRECENALRILEYRIRTVFAPVQGTERRLRNAARIGANSPSGPEVRGADREHRPRCAGDADRREPVRLVSRSQNRTASPRCGGRARVTFFGCSESEQSPVASIDDLLERI